MRKVDSKSLSNPILKKSHSQDYLNSEELHAQTKKKNSLNPKLDTLTRKNYQHILKDMKNQKETEQEEKEILKTPKPNKTTRFSKKADSPVSENKNATVSKFQQHMNEVDQIVLMNK